MPTDPIERNDQVRTEPERYWRKSPGNPNPQGGQGLGMSDQRLCYRSIGGHPANCSQDDNAINFVEPAVEVMLHDDHRCGGVGDHCADRVAHNRSSGRIKHRGRFVEQDQPGPECEYTGESQSLGLATGYRTNRMLTPVRESDRIQRFLHSSPDFFAGQPQVLRSEGNFSTDLAGDHSVSRVLDEKASK